MIYNQPRSSRSRTPVLMVLMAIMGMVVALVLLNDSSKNSPARVYIPEELAASSS